MSEANPQAKTSAECSSITIRARPKIIFLYPTLIAAIVAGIWTLLSGPNFLEASPAPGRIFWWMFATNLLAIAFDFTRGEFVALVLFFGVAILGIILLDQQWSVIEPVQIALGKIDLRAHPHMYFMVAAALALIYVGVIIQGHFDYWEISHNEILHHSGILGDLRRFPAPNLRLQKEITDLFEYCLFFPLGGVGRIVIHPQGSQRAVVLENVIGVNRIERRIQVMLASLQVKVDTSGHIPSSEA